MTLSNPHTQAKHSHWLFTSTLAIGFSLAATGPLAQLARELVSGAPARALENIIPSARGDGGMNVTATGRVGIGLENPARQLHLVGDNAVVRLDRTTDAATFMMVRTDADGNVLKTFSVGTRASGPNVGEFQIADFGQSTGGNSDRRMTITNEGEAHFTGTVRAPNFVTTSSARYKDNIQTLQNTRDAIQQLRGVRFTQKESGQASLGVIAEEIQSVYPELVETEDGAPVAVNYSALIAVLLEAVKEQQSVIDSQRDTLASQQTQLDHLENHLADLDKITDRMNAVEAHLRSAKMQNASLAE